MVWVVGVLALWLLWGPLVPLAVVAALCVPRIRWWVQDRFQVGRRVTGAVTGACLALGAVVLAVPDGWLPVPPGAGVWSAPSYVGRPAVARIPGASGATLNPHLAPASSTRPGPLGLQPEVETSWFGLEHCGRLELTSTDRLVAWCTDRSGASLRLVDPDSMRPTTTLELPGSTCADDDRADAAYLDDRDRVVVATGEREILAVRTATAKGDALVADATWDLKPYVPFGDCLVAVSPDWAGRIWWASQQGLVGTLVPASGQVRVVDLGERIERGLVADESGVHVVTDEALHRFVAMPDATPQAVWRTAYDGTSGSAPVLLDGGVVAITDEVDDQAGVVFVAREGGRVVCRHPVFAVGSSVVDSELASVGTGVVVANDDGHGSAGTMLGFTGSAGVARVDLVDGACVERWSNDSVSTGSGVVASRPQSLLYAATKRPSVLGVSAWYVTVIDAETGRSMWSVRTGTGLLADSDDSRVMLGAGGTAWLGTRAGLVRIADRS